LRPRESSPRRAKLFETAVDVPVPERLRRRRNGSLRPLETLHLAAGCGGQAHLWRRCSICRFVHGYLTRYRVPALTVKMGEQRLCLISSAVDPDVSKRAGPAIRYEKHEQIKVGEVRKSAAASRRASRAERHHVRKLDKVTVTSWRDRGRFRVIWMRLPNSVVASLLDRTDGWSVVVERADQDRADALCKRAAKCGAL